MEQLAKLIISLGFLLMVVGLIVLFFGKVLPFGRLPGDFVYKGETTTFYFPLMSSIVISIVLSIIFRIVMK